VLDRGDRGESIFKEDQDREWFIATLGEACAKTGGQVPALCLMPNHFHLVAKLRAETTVTVKWIAQRLAMGTAG
jgi:putative transposase